MFSDREPAATQTPGPVGHGMLVSTEHLQETSRGAAILRGSLTGSFILHATAVVGLIWIGQSLLSNPSLPLDRYQPAPYIVDAPPLVVKVSTSIAKAEPLQQATEDHGEAATASEPPPAEPKRTARRKRARRLEKIRATAHKDQPAEAPATAALRPQAPAAGPIEPLTAVTTDPNADAPGPEDAEETANVASHGDGTGDAIAAPEEGDGIDMQALLSRYRKTVSNAVHKRYRYPRMAKRAGLEGRVVLEVIVDGQGEIVAVNVSRSSGHAILDEAAVASVSRLGQVPAPPSELGWNKRAVRVAFRYQLRS